MNFSFWRTCAMVVGAAVLVLGGVSPAAAQTLSCGGKPCSAIAKAITLHAAATRAAVAVTVGGRWVARIPPGYREIAHNGAVDVYGYPATTGRKELLLHDTSVAAYGDLGTADDWRMEQRAGTKLFFHAVANPPGWKGFALNSSASRHGDRLLELYAVGFSKAEFEAILAGIRTKR